MKCFLLITFFLSKSFICDCQIPKLLGTCGSGGFNDRGTLFTLDGDGNNFDIVCEFPDTGFGHHPSSKLILSGGKLYGLTSNGGEFGDGVIYSVDTILHSYSLHFNFIDSLGSNPKEAFLLASSNVFYGITEKGGLNDGGVLFSFDPSNNQYTKLHDFLGNESYSYSTLMQGIDGKLYGTVAGTLFSYDISTSTYNIEQSFNIWDDLLFGDITETSDGKIFGIIGPNIQYQNGVIYCYKPDSNLFTIVHSFNQIDGIPAEFNQNGLYLSGDSIIYGLADGGLYGYGMLFSFNPLTLIYKNLYNFNSNGLALPLNNIIQLSNGKLCGITAAGGLNNRGGYFTFDVINNIFENVYDFDTSGGIGRENQITFLSGETLYGTAIEGGIYGDGLMYKVDIQTNTFTPLINFDGNSPMQPLAIPVMAGNNDFYVTTRRGGVFNNGTLIKVNIPNHHFDELFKFPFSGANPTGLIEASDGNLYGTTPTGSTIFKFDPLQNTLTTEFTFTNLDGAGPYGSMLEIMPGILFGSTSGGGNQNNGVLFSYDIINHSYHKLFDFNGQNGKSPREHFIKDQNLMIYGITAEGGINNAGVIYSFDVANNSFTQLYDLNDSICNDSEGGLALINNNLYGTTSFGGQLFGGIIFKYNLTNFTFNILHEFNNINGQVPFGDLLVASDGNIYGTTYGGGSFGRGLIYRINPNNDSVSTVYSFNSLQGCSPLEGLCEINITTGLSSQISEINIHVFPNPTNNKINIIYPGNQIVKFALYDVSSREILTKSFSNNCTINVENLNEGIYFYRFISEGNLIKSGKLIIN